MPVTGRPAVAPSRLWGKVGMGACMLHRFMIRSAWFAMKVISCRILSAVPNCLSLCALRVKSSQAVALNVSPSALIKLSICSGVEMKGGASWMVSPP